MKESSWLCTFITQISLCFCVYIAFNIGGKTDESSRRGVEMYFMSVAGGFRPEKEQTLLLKQMAKVSKAYKAQFVVSISELGENDPLNLNATTYFQSLKVPWYTTKPFKGKRTGSYVKHTKVQHGKILDIVMVNTELFQGSSAGSTERQLQWLTQTLEESTSEWRIVVGFHPLLACNGSIEAKDNPGCLHEMFLNHGVDVYLSGLACTEDVPGQSAKQPGNIIQPRKGPSLTPIHQAIHQHTEEVNGFFLHRVNSLEFVTYLINLTGDIVHKIELQQSGKEVT